MRRLPVLTASAFAAAALCVTAPSILAAEVEFLRVSQAQGKVETRAAASGGWVPAAPGAILRKGDRLRTDSEAFVSVDFDRNLHGSARLGGSSELRVISVVPPRLRLDRGVLLVLRSGESDGLSEPPDRRSVSGSPLVIEAAAHEVRLGWGGVSVEAEGQRLTVKVFDERAQIGEPDGSPPPMSVYEGFTYTARSRERGTIFRATFEDYRPWEAWMRLLYERKDDLAAERREAALSP